MPQKANTTSGADLLLEILRNYAVEYLFSSPGTEWAPLWEALAKQRGKGIGGPVYLGSRHEDIATGMALGYAKATSKLAVCAVHSTVGTLHASMGIRAAYQQRTPMLVLSGESLTLGEGGHAWVGGQWERFLTDYGGPARLVEPFVKSTFCVNSDVLLPGVIHRACRMAMNAPAGPVFLSVPYEFLAAPAISSAPAATEMPVTALADPAALRQAATILATSKRPMIITENLGRNPRAVSDLVDLAEMLGAPVVESMHPEQVNFPRRHDLHGGFSPQPFLEKSDAVLLLDMIGSPWYPDTAGRPAKATIITIGEDPLRERMPYNAIAPDLVISGRADNALQQLISMLKAKLRGQKKAIAGRSARIARINKSRRAKWHKEARATAKNSSIDMRWFCQELNAVLPSNAVLVDETIISRTSLLNTFDGMKPGHFIDALSGGLGLGLGAGLGVKVANPDKPVITIVGDGTFNYNPPLAALGFCQEYDMPMLIIIANNNRYRSMQMAVDNSYPNGWAKRTDTYFGAQISPSVNYAGMAALVDGYGETVEDVAEIRPAIARAFQALKAGKPVILDIIIDDEMKFLTSVH